MRDELILHPKHTIFFSILSPILLFAGCFFGWLFVNGLPFIFNTRDLSSILVGIFIEILCILGLALGFGAGIGLFIQIDPLIINKEIIQRPRNIINFIVKIRSKLEIKDVMKIIVIIKIPDYINRIYISTKDEKDGMVFGDWYRQNDLHSILDQLKIVVNETKFVYEKYNI